MGGSLCDEYRRRNYTVKIMFLHTNGPSVLYMYPTRPDILQVPRQYISMKVDLCSAA